jgi:MFS family permease
MRRMAGNRSLRDVFGFMRGNILVITVTRILGMFSRRMVFPYASLYILALGGESAQIGFINSLAPLAGLVIFPLAGYYADRAGRVRLIALSGFLSAANTLLYVLAPSWEWLALAAFFQGVMVFHFPASSAIVADSLTPQNRGIGIATMNTVPTAISIFCPYIAGALLELYDVEMGMRILYGVLLTTNLVGAMINLRFLKETSTGEESHDLSNMREIFRDAYGGIPSVLRRLPGPIRALAVVIVLGFMANGISGPFWVVYAIEQIGLSSVEWGLILLVESALRTLLNIPMGVLVDRYGRARFIVVSLFLSLFSIPLFVLARGFTDVLLIRVVVAVANTILIPACTALMADTVPRDIRGRVMSALGRGSFMIGATGGGGGGPGMGFVITIPMMIAALSGGFLYGANPAYPWYFVGASLIVSLAVAALFIRDPSEAEI